MLKNNNFTYKLKLTALALLLVTVTLCGTSCGSIGGMFDFLEGDDNTSGNISYDSGNSQDDNESTEIPDTAAELFESSAFGDGLMITGYVGTDTVVKIPAQIDGKAVLAIGDKAIKDTKAEDGSDVSITSVIIPSSVTQIAFSALSSCKKLENLTVPFVGGRADDHTYIGYVFGSYSAAGNKSFIPDSLKTVKAGGVVIADEAFAGCENIESIYLESVSSVGKSAFKGCSALKNLYIPDTVTFIGESAFNGCVSLTDISLPYLGNGSDKLFLGAVFGAEDYTKNQSCVPDTLRNVTIGALTDIPEGAFYECNNIRSITVKGNVNSVGKDAFYRCRKLKELEIGMVNSLSPYAFGYCAALGEVKLAADITDIPEGAFYGCSALRTVSFGEDANLMPSTVKSLGKGAFAYCESLTAMELSSSITSIEEQAFYGCSYLLSVKLHDGITSVGDDAFKGCGNLKALDIGSGVTSIGKGAFSYCSSLKSVNLPANVSAFGEYAFAYCSYLEEVSITCDNAAVGEGAFAACGKVVISVTGGSATYEALIASGLGNSNLKSTQ